MKKRVVFGLFLIVLVLLSCVPEEDLVGQPIVVVNEPPDHIVIANDQIGEQLWVKVGPRNWKNTGRVESDGTITYVSAGREFGREEMKALIRQEKGLGSRVYKVAISTDNRRAVNYDSSLFDVVPAERGSDDNGPAAPPSGTPAPAVAPATSPVVVSSQFKSFVEARNKKTSNQYSTLIKEEKGNQLLLNNGRSIIKLSDDLYFDQSMSSFYDKDGREISGHVNYELRDSSGKLVRSMPVYAPTSQSVHAVIYEYVQI